MQLTMILNYFTVIKIKDLSLVHLPVSCFSTSLEMIERKDVNVVALSISTNGTES
jgi:hypothetical protein